MDEQLRQKVEALYGLKITSSRQIRDIHQIITDQGPLCLKGVTYKPEKLLYIYHAMEHLLKNGFELIPAFIHTLTGDAYFEYNDQLYFVTEWINGRECDFKDLVDLELAVVALAKMHRASLGFKPPSAIKQKSRQGKWLKRFHSRMKELQEFKAIAEQKTEPTKFDQYYLKHVDSKLLDCVKAIKLLELANYEELAKRSKKAAGFCHNDFVYHNVMVNDAEPQAYIIDFDYARHDMRTYDLARMMRRVIKEKDYQADLIDIILSAYNSEYPLETVEYVILAAFLQFPQRFWRMADRYYNRKRDWSEKRFYERLKRSVRRQQHQKKLVKEILTYGNNQS